MSQELEIPRFGELLQPSLAQLAPGLAPALLAELERAAAARYRTWAAECGDPERARVLLECAAGEEEIARRVDKLFPAMPEDRERIEALLPEARRVFLAVFERYGTRDQYRIQAGAELQGAAAWRSLVTSQTDPAVRDELHACAKLEEASAARLESLLAD